MFSQHQPVHQFSPQRRQVSGANKRLSPKKAHLGNEEASNVGPQKLFSDLKQTASAKKASTSSSVFGKPSRAFGEKTNQSPQRRQEGGSGTNDVPVKPQGSSALAGGSKQKGRESQLVSPSKVQDKTETIFLASSSPSKRKKRAEGARSSQQGNDELTSSPTKQRTPKVQTAPLAPQPNIVTPASNVGHAGAMRQRMGEMLDAMLHADESVHAGDSSLLAISEGLTEEQLYPEIEYMPPRVEVPYEFPQELDGLPRGAEMGDMLRSVPFAGFYKATRPASIELQRQKALADVPDRIEGGNLDDFEQITGVEEEDLWPDVEVVETVGGSKGAAVPTTIQGRPTSKIGSIAQPIMRKVGSVPSTSQRDAKPTTSAKLPSVGRTSAKLPSVGRTSSKSLQRPTERTVATGSGSVRSTGASFPSTVQPRAKALSGNIDVSTIKTGSKPSAGSRAKLAGPSVPSSTKPKALAEKNSNATVIRRKVVNPALRDFENDKMGKLIQAKLQASEAEERGFEGFAL